MTQNLLNEACEQFSEAARINKKHPNTYNDWGAALLTLAALSADEENQQFLEQARNKCLEAESIKPGFASYNLACISALCGELEKCREHLETAHSGKKIPSASQLENDPDFRGVRKLDWFKELAAKVRSES